MPEFPSGDLRDQRDALLAFLRFHRETILWKADGVEAEGLRQRSTASSMTLAGLLKHCAVAETWWFHHVFAGRREPRPFDLAVWDTDEDWEWTSALSDAPEDLRQMYRDAIARSDHIIAEAALDDVARGSSSFAGKPTLGWIVLHVATETARHAGHADLIREAVDGAVGWRRDGDT